MRLSDTFYDTFSKEKYPEILRKRTRAYECILFQTHYDYFICVPFRTEITHGYAYHFKLSKRSKNHKSGLDYTKSVIINDLEYLDDAWAVIDQDEYKETITNIERIKRDALQFVEDYVRHMKNENLLHPSEFRRRYSYSPLKYFHEELGIS